MGNSLLGHEQQCAIRRTEQIAVSNNLHRVRLHSFNALEGAAQQLANQGAIKGVFQTTVQVAGQTVTVRGAVVEGVLRLSTAFVP
jgi:hypothetical protein